jgi:GAF domain-containing protein
MMVASIPSNERERLAALHRYRILDTKPEVAFDELAEVASTICNAPIALVSLVDASRQWFKARVGLAAQETPRASSFCAHAVLGAELFIVHDALVDPRFAKNPLVLGDPHIRFYAGAPLTSPAGLNLGTLCVIDRRPRVLDDRQRSALVTLARQVMTQLDLRLKRALVETVHHELRTPLTSIRGSLGLLASGVVGELSGEARELVLVAERNSVRLVNVMQELLDFDEHDRGATLVDDEGPGRR